MQTFLKFKFEDYYFLEMELAATYAPQNYYCFAIDKKAPKLFHEQIQNLSTCFPNVFYSKVEYPLDSAGHNQNSAHMECLSILRQHKWKYVIMLQVSSFLAFLIKFILKTDNQSTKQMNKMILIIVSFTTLIEFLPLILAELLFQVN